MKYADFVAMIIIAHMGAVRSTITLLKVTVRWAMMICRASLPAKDGVSFPEILPVRNFPKFLLFLYVLVVVSVKQFVVPKAVCIPTENSFENPVSQS